MSDRCATALRCPPPTLLFVATRNPLSVVFIALSPLIMVGTFFDKQYTDRRRLKAQTAEYVAALAALGVDLEGLGRSWSGRAA